MLYECHNIQFKASGLVLNMEQCLDKDLAPECFFIYLPPAQ